MKDIEKILKNMGLKKVPESLDKKMEDFFADHRKIPSNARTKKIILYMVATGIAASLALAFVVQFFNTDKTQPNNKITETEIPSVTSELKPKVKIVKMSNDFSEVFGVEINKKLSFFDSEKSKIARISIR